MAEDERLREALLELQLLRDREAKSLRETRNLLECLEAYSSATMPGEALSSIFVSLRNTIGADLSLLGEVSGDGAFTVSASDNRELIGLCLTPPYDFVEAVTHGKHTSTAIDHERPGDGCVILVAGRPRE